ncbi:MAG: MinD/ParA family protein [Desulfitobacteriaceae bacterium]
MANYPDRLDLSIPLHRGYLLLLPVGTVIRWLSPGLDGYTSQVIARGPQVWSVTLPVRNPRRHNTKVLAVGSGKGGVGKTTFSINLSLALSQLNQRVILLDADLGMANVEVLLGLESSLNLAHVIQGDCTLRDVLKRGPGGIRVLPGTSGISALTRLDTLQFNRIIAGFSDLEEDCDILILDTGAGITELVLMFLGMADELLLLTNPEPHALMDTYALMKVLAQRNPTIKPKIIMNRCESAAEARQSTQTLIVAARQFLALESVALGWLPADKNVTRSIKERFPLFLAHPDLPFSRQVLGMAEQLVGMSSRPEQSSGIIGFWLRLKRSFA